MYNVALGDWYRSVVDTGKVLLKDISSKVAVIDLCVAEGEGEYCKYFVYPLARKLGCS